MTSCYALEHPDTLSPAEERYLESRQNAEAVRIRVALATGRDSVPNLLGDLAERDWWRDGIESLLRMAAQPEPLDRARIADRFLRLADEAIEYAAKEVA